MLDKGDSDHATHFNHRQYSEAYPPGVEDTYWHIARNRIIERNLRAANAARVLDIGCGRGILVEYLGLRGIYADGVELANAPVPRSLAGRVHVGMAAQQLPKRLRETYDSLVIADVIEHIPEPTAFLRELQTSFPAVRTVVVTVPARKELWSNYDDYFGHYRRYDLKDLRSALEAAGLRVEHLSYMFRSLYLPLRIILKLRGKRSVRISGTARPTPTHYLLGRLIELDYCCIPNFIYGTSAICRASVP
jgi:SAM-dependent methyltransferase